MTNLPLPSPFRRRWFFQRSETDQILTVSSLFSCLLVVARILHTGSLAFIFMPWNLFLAYAPYYISTMVTRRAVMGNRLVTIIGLILWLLFIPNAFYILTDLYHLADGHRNSRVPEWFDLVLILSFAWNGLLLGVLSTRQVERLLAPDASLTGRLVFLYPVMWLNALGVYIGRYLRYNSWDIVTNPVDLLGDITRMIAHPLRYHDAWGMIFCYSILLTIMYSLLNKNH
ncbi:MAG TPA: DUF1361 domain-containing protein [Puia sp.]|jgi:uncharacterized membrane protein|nr:DUF1361 domain-containing protein [Puia sp.]